MNIEKKHAMILALPGIGVGIPGTVNATEDSINTKVTENPTSQEPDLNDNISNLSEISIDRPARGLSVTERLFAEFDDEIPEDPRVVAALNSNDKNQPIGLTYNGNTSEDIKRTMKNPIPDNQFGRVQSDLVAESQSATDRVARIASVAVASINSDESIVVDNNSSIGATPRVEQIATVSQEPLQPSLSGIQTHTPVTINGISVGLSAGQAIDVTPEGILLKNDRTIDHSNNTPSATISDERGNQEKQADAEPITSLDGLTQKIIQEAKEAGGGYYFMPDPIIKTGDTKPTYLFDKNTCNSERRSYPEHIAAVIAISEKYNELVNTKYHKYQGTVLDVGDFMSSVHIEHDHDSPAVDLRSRKITSVSGSNDGPAFVPVSLDYDVDFTIELIEYAQTLTYNNEPILKYVITKDTDQLSEKTKHMKRYGSERNLFIFKNDHPEHVHLAFNTQNILDELEPEGDYGEPCEISGASFTESNMVTVDESSLLNNQMQSQEQESTDGEVEENNLEKMSSGNSQDYVEESNVTVQSRPIIVDDPSLIEHMREEIIGDSTDESTPIEDLQDEVLTEQDQSTIIDTESNTDNAPKSFIRIDNVVPSSELSRVITAGRLRDGVRDTTEIIEDLSDSSQRILNNISSYAPISPYLAVELRQNNPGFSEYFPQLENADRQLSDLEVMARAKVAHEIVFGERYGTGIYNWEKIRDDIEKIVAFSNRESLRYPGAVGDFRTEGENSGSGGLIQILNWDVSIDENIYEGVRDFDANLDPLQNLVHAFQMVDSNRASGRSAFADWESGWKSDEGRRADMEKYEDNLYRIRAQEIYNQVENMGSIA